MRDISYNETTEVLEDMVGLGVVDVRRGKTQSEDVYRLSDFGIWLYETGRFLEFDHLPARRREIRSLFEENRRK